MTIYIPYWSITPVTLDPVTANASVLYADINAEANSGYYLFRNETTSFTQPVDIHSCSEEM